MDYIHKLPFILGAAATILYGLASYKRINDNQTLFLRMAVCMVVFYLLGLYIRNTIKSIQADVQERIEREKREEEERLAQEMARQNEQESGENNSRPVIDIRVEDNNEDFSPLKVSRIIKSSINQDNSSEQTE